ncbi:uncharacterized protein [Parasteatoda tepidariorum]|uniref:uncharacterized protein n=1 Tax=Parasteatoda tepidariorum TaxID=114398 RepID=UPI00077FE1F1|nr:uncharacterized protein LOC107457426 [Parasteatoda tepidariorum]
MALIVLFFIGAFAVIAIDPCVSASLELIDEPVELQDWPKIPKLPFNCTMEDGITECCGRLQVSLLNLDKNSCLKLIFIGEIVALNISFTIDEHQLFNYQISAKNPPPICVGVPFAKLFGDICIEFYDLHVSKDHTQVCMKIKPRLFRKVITEYDTGCFNMTSTEMSTEASLTQLY